MNELQLFEHPEFGKIRTLEEDGKILFCGVDVARALGYSNPHDAISRHCKGVVKREGVSTTINQHGTITKQTTEMAFLPEGDVYRLIVRSKLPAAETFENWVFDEVLPTIRKTGSYSANLSPAELFMQQATVNLEFERQLNALADRTTQTEERVTQAEARVTNAAAVFAVLAYTKDD